MEGVSEREVCSGVPVREGYPFVGRNGVHHELRIVGTVKRLERKGDEQLNRPTSFLAFYTELT